MGETIGNQPRSESREFSWGGALGSGAGRAYRILRGTPGRNQRLLRGVEAGVSGFAGPLRNVLRVLFLEISGFIFLFFSLAVISAFIREYKRYSLHEVGVGHVILAGAVGAMFLYFGVSQFWRARRRRSKA